MNKRKSVVKEPLQCEQDFSRFLKRVREESDVPGEVLVEGLMSGSRFSRIESGQRPVCKTMRNRLLERLGVTPDMYENLLDIEDYTAWEHQQKILCAVERKDFRTAEMLIREYENADPVRDRVKRQFCLVMKAELLRLQGADYSVLRNVYEKAVRLTVPAVDQVYNASGSTMERKLLSVVEVNAALEYEFYKRTERKEGCTCRESFAAKCRFWMDYVEGSLFDELSQAKIYPKIVYYYMREVLSWGSATSLANACEILQVCDRAVEMLRNTGRAFYLIELLEYKRRLLEYIIINFVENGEGQKAEEYKTTLQESEELEDLLKKLYTEYQVPVYMQDCTYLYRQRWVFSIGDVLRIRRNMLGLTQKEVSDGICSVKTLRRAEKKQVNMQRDTLGKVLRRLGLSKEIQKTEIVTNDMETLMLKDKLVFYRNNHDTEKSRELLNLLKRKICLEIPENLQYILEAEVSLDWMEGRITKEEFITREQEALRCTLKIRELQNRGDVYLTEMELLCICKTMQKLVNTEKREQIDFLLRFFEKYESACTLDCYIVMYEFVMTCISNELGNMGEYQFATDLDRKALKEVLRCRRLWEAASFIYDILWNEKEQKKDNAQQMETEKMAEGLRKCIAFSHFCKRTFYEKFYLDKIKSINV